MAKAEKYLKILTKTIINPEDDCTVPKDKNDDSQSLQMIERPLMSPDEMDSMPKCSFVVMTTGTQSMKIKLKLFLDWQIQFQKLLEVPARVGPQFTMWEAGFRTGEPSFRY